MNSIEPVANGSEIANMLCMRCGKRFSEKSGHECEKAEKYAKENKFIKTKKNKK